MFYCKNIKKYLQIVNVYTTQTLSLLRKKLIIKQATFESIATNYEFEKCLTFQDTQKCQKGQGTPVSAFHRLLFSGQADSSVTHSGVGLQQQKVLLVLLISFQLCKHPLSSFTAGNWTLLLVLITSGRFSRIVKGAHQEGNTSSHLHTSSYPAVSVVKPAATVVEKSLLLWRKVFFIANEAQQAEFQRIQKSKLDFIKQINKVEMDI